MNKFKVVYINLHGDRSIRAAYLHSLISKEFNMYTINFRRFILTSRAPSENELRTLEKVIDKLKPNAILMSVLSVDFWDAVKITKMLRKKVEKYNIAWGGVHPTIDPERCLKYVNVIIRGEGEEVVIEYLKAIKEGKNINNIKNLWIKKDKKIIKNDFRPLVQNLDSLPFSDFSDKNKLYILGNSIFTKNPLPHIKYEYNISFSRGCPFSCRYCINHIYNREFKNKYLRRRSINNAIKELIEAKKQFPRLEFINFWDDVFLIDKKWIKEFIQKYKKYVNLPFFTYGNATFINEENMKLLKDAGLIFFDMGIQSGSERVRKDIFGRMDSNEQILKAAYLLKKLNIPRGYDFIFSEFETEEDMERGLNFILRIPKPFKPQVNKLAYYVNFDITNMALKQGKINICQVVSMSQKKRILQVVMDEDAKKNTMLNYFHLIGKRWIPNFIIRYMLKNKFHEKYQRPMAKLGYFVYKIDESKYAIREVLRMLRRGEFKYLYNRLFHKQAYF